MQNPPQPQGSIVNTAAAKSFQENWQTITDLQTITGGRAGRTHAQSAAINKAALIFCITAWEGYVEDALREAARHLAENCPTYTELPKKVRQSLEKAVTPKSGYGSLTPSGRTIAEIAGDSWRVLLPILADEATEGSNFNTPKTRQVQTLFIAWCGVDVTDAWSWQRFKAPNAAERLDESISIRGKIIHTGEKPDGLHKAWIDTYGDRNIKKLVEKTDQVLISHVNDICGHEIGSAGSFGL